MSTTATAATIRLGVDLASLQTGLQKAATIAEQQGQSIKASLLKTADQSAEGFKRMGASLASALNPLNLAVSALGTSASLAGLGTLIASAYSAADSMADLSIKTGVQVEQLSRFSTVAKLSGTEMDSVAGVLKKLSISAVEAYSGNDKLARSFEALGISTKDLKTISPDELLIRIAQGIQGIDPMVVQDLMAQLGGKGATNVLPFLRELNDRIDETSVKISTQFASDAKIFSDNLKLIEINIQSLGVSIGSQLIPQYNILFDTLRNGQGVFSSITEALKNDLAIMGVDFRKVPETIQQTQAELETATGLEKATLERRLNVLQKHQAAVSSVLSNDIDPNKTAAAQRAIAANSGGGTAGDSFIKGLQARIEKADQGEYAMLRLQAAEKGVLDQADPLIAKLKELDIGRAIASYEQTLQTQNDELEFQISLIGKSAQEVQRLNAQRKIELELAKQIDQITRTKGSISPENLEQMQLSADAAINISSASISRRIELENRWQTGASSAFQKYQADAQNTAKGVEQTFGNAFRGMEDALVQFAMTGKLNFNSLANSIIADIIRMQARAAVAGFANFLGQAIGNLIGGSVSGTGYTSASPSGPGSYNYAGSEMTITALPSALGNVFSGAPSLSAYSNTVQTSPKFFNFGSLHRFANGGVFAEAGPEAVMPLTRMGNGKLGVHSNGGNGVNISIFNQASQDTEIEPRVNRNESGGYDIELFVRKAMLDDAKRNGPHTQMLSSMFGLRRSS